MDVPFLEIEVQPGIGPMEKIYTVISEDTPYVLVFNYEIMLIGPEGSWEVAQSVNNDYMVVEPLQRDTSPKIIIDGPSLKYLEVNIYKNPNNFTLTIQGEWEIEDLTADMRMIRIGRPDPIGDNPDEYIPQDEPTLEDFLINVSPRNSDYIQAAIETARQMNPSFELFIRAINYAHEQDNLSIRIDRNLFPSFLQYASPLEIYKIYTGKRVLFAQILLDFIFRGAYREVNFHPNPKWRNHIINYMEQQGYVYGYFGFVIKESTIVPNTTVTPDNFRKSITPDQQIIMEAWRQKILHGPVTKIFNTEGDREYIRAFDLLELKQLERQNRKHGIAHIRLIDPYNKFQIVDPTNVKIDVTHNPKFPVNTHLGFPKDDLMYAIERNVRRLGTKLTRDYIRYNTDDVPPDVGKTLLPYNWSSTKPYLMMIYHELLVRDYIVE